MDDKKINSNDNLEDNGISHDDIQDLQGSNSDRDDDGRTIALDITDEMKTSYRDYALSVIVSRAVPDVRDGLKPVHRRIIYSMYNSGYFSNRLYRKSARLVGDVMGRYHPHSDAAIYDSLVRMAQDFSFRIPLIEGQGNFGSIDGDAAAAMRYTECTAAKITRFFIDDIANGGAEFIPNYDGLELEPKVLPVMFPNLLVNGSNGIAVGMSTNIPPHNLADVIDACCLYIDDNAIDTNELIDVIKGPDFPTGGIILKDDELKSAYLTGRGIFKYRGKTEIEESVDGKKSIIITEMPFLVNKASLVEKIALLVRDKKIDGISDLRDESNKEGIRIVVTIKKTSSPEIVLNQLYSYTQLQTSFGVRMLALNSEWSPKMMNLKDIISEFINFREDTIKQRTEFLLNKAQARAHILLGLSVAIHNIEKIVELIKSSSSTANAKEKLLAAQWHIDHCRKIIDLIEPNTLSDVSDVFKFSEEQAKAILDMKLSRITALEYDKIEADLMDLAKEIEYYFKILNSKTFLFDVMKKELLKVKAEFASARRTELLHCKNSGIQDIEDLIEPEEMVVTMTQSGYIKRVSLSTYKSQNRGGKGRLGSVVKDEDIISQVIIGNTHSSVLCFSNIGQVYSMKIYKIPNFGPHSKGRSIVNLLPLREGEKIAKIVLMPEQYTESLSIVFSTSSGGVKRNSFSDFEKVNVSGKIAISLEKNDKLVDAHICTSDKHLMVLTKKGKALRFPVDNLRVIKGRNTKAIRGIQLSNDDSVISATILNGIEWSSEEKAAYLGIPYRKRIGIAEGTYSMRNDTLNGLSKERIIEMASAEEFILTITNNGYGKRTSSYEYTSTSRGCKGIVSIVTSAKTGDVVASMPAKCNDELVLVTNQGKLIRCKLNDVKVIGRRTSGVLLFKIDKKDEVVSVSLIAATSEIAEDVEEQTIDKNSKIASLPHVVSNQQNDLLNSDDSSA